jgi:hypothetical protein
LTEQDVLNFVAQSVRSLWALEVLLLLRRDRLKVWSVGELVRETRSSQTAVGDALAMLTAAGFVAEDNGVHRYWPVSPALETVASEIEALYAAKPTAVIKAILTTPDNKLRTFSDAFKLKD